VHHGRIRSVEATTCTVMGSAELVAQKKSVSPTSSIFRMDFTQYCSLETEFETA